MNMCINTVNIAHFLQLILITGGLSLSVFTHFFVCKIMFSSFHKTYSDITKFLQFRSFLKNLDKDFPLMKYTNAVEDCAIC